MQPGNYSPHQYPRFGPREQRHRFARSPYQNFQSPSYSPNSQTTYRSRAAIRNVSPCHPNFSQTENSAVGRDNFESDFIPLNTSGINSSISSCGTPDSPSSYHDHSFNRRSYRGFNNNRKPHWNSYNSHSGGSAGRYRSPNDYFKNRNNQDNSPNGTGKDDGIRMYISEEFLKDPWEHLQKPKQEPAESS
ncbi:hypothetical protein CHUAL_013581 [Chamberlinius hualienensis]